MSYSFTLTGANVASMDRGPGKGLSSCGTSHDHRAPTHKWTVLGVKTARLFKGFDCYCTLFEACMCIREHTHHRVCAEVKEQVSGVHNVGTKDRTRTASLGRKCLCRTFLLVQILFKKILTFTQALPNRVETDYIGPFTFAMGLVRLKFWFFLNFYDFHSNGPMCLMAVLLKDTAWKDKQPHDSL